jgi:hypothetical protein
MQHVTSFESVAIRLELLLQIFLKLTLDEGLLTLAAAPLESKFPMYCESR